MAGPSQTDISSNAIVPGSSFYQKGEWARGSISKYSSSPQGATPTSMITLPQACLLNSSAEMEEKKEAHTGGNGTQKTEREVKRKQREEEQKQKAKERQKKAEERAKKVKEAANTKSHSKEQLKVDKEC